jgi:hypothetical protein
VTSADRRSPPFGDGYLDSPGAGAGGPVAQAHRKPQARKSSASGRSRNPRRRSTDGAQRQAPRANLRIVETRIPPTTGPAASGCSSTSASSRSSRATGQVSRPRRAPAELEDHACRLGRRGGFITRLREGTWVGHIAEHIALELQNLAAPTSATARPDHRRIRPLQRDLRVPRGNRSGSRRAGSRSAREPSSSRRGVACVRLHGPARGLIRLRSLPRSVLDRRSPRGSPRDIRTSASTVTRSSSSGRASISCGSGRR